MAGREANQPLQVKDVLFTVLVDDLRTMVRTLQKHLKSDRSGSCAGGLEPVSQRKPDVINWIKTVITDPNRAELLYTKMHSLEQAAVRETVHAPDGVLNRRKIAAKYGKFPLLTTSGRSDLVGGETSPIPGKQCPLLCIVLAGKSEMATDVQRVFREFVPEPVMPEPEQASSLPEKIRTPAGDSTRDYVIHATEQSALFDVQAMLNLVVQGKVGVGAKTGRVSKVGARVLRAVLSQGDFYEEDAEAPHQYDVQMGAVGIRPFAWPLLLQAGKLAQIEGSKLALTKSGQAALGCCLGSS